MVSKLKYFLGKYDQMKNDKRYAKYLIGDYTFGRPTVYSWNRKEQLKIGKFCSIAGGVCIFLGGGGAQVRLGNNFFF